jgi:hypothetical protein
MLRKIHGTNFFHIKFMDRTNIKWQNGPVLPPVQVFYFNDQVLDPLSRIHNTRHTSVWFGLVSIVSRIFIYLSLQQNFLVWNPVYQNHHFNMQNFRESRFNCSEQWITNSKKIHIPKCPKHFRIRHFVRIKQSRS